MLRSLFRLSIVFALCPGVGSLTAACGGGGASCASICEKQANRDSSGVGSQQAIINLRSSLCEKTRPNCPETSECLGSKTSCGDQHVVHVTPAKTPTAKECTRRLA